MTIDCLALAADLCARGEPFALATVVRCERPTSAKPGAKAVIRGDGTLEGWIGGACAEPVVVREALAALRDGQPRFISLTGEGGRVPGGREGVLEFPMACHSGGTLEVYVEPFLPKPLLLLVGHGPVLETLATLGRATDFDVVTVDHHGGDDVATLAQTPGAFVVVATHGTFDEDALANALESAPDYVSLVASRKRAAVIVDNLRRRGVSPERLGALKAPAGLDIGATTPEEVAVSILAEIVQVRRSAKSAGPERRPAKLEATEATDPVCGMVVDIATARYRSDAAGRTEYFCCLGCKESFEAAHA
jgi:xanthine dehydrogenase accessory factor